jgi:hypothetical protein
MTLGDMTGTVSLAKVLAPEMNTVKGDTGPVPQKEEDPKRPEKKMPQGGGL